MKSVNELRAAHSTQHEDYVRILRLYSFEGPRSLVEKQVQNSLPNGSTRKGVMFGSTKADSEKGDIIFTVATLGDFPEIMSRAQTTPLAKVPSDSVDLAGKCVYLGRGTDHAAIYNAARAQGATHVTLYDGDADSAIVAWTLTAFRELFEIPSDPWNDLTPASTNDGPDEFSGTTKAPHVSAQPCGCNLAVNWICANHRAEIESNNR